LVRLDIGIGILPRWMAADEIECGLLVAQGICQSVSRNLITGGIQTSPGEF
jgi:DNA-binding transcriptional LysR family regulator